MTLRWCLKSIKAQTYPIDEIIVVDGYSTDDTRKVALEFGAKVILAHGTQAAARNVGIKNSKGEYILFLDSDQWLEERTVEECISKCIKDGAEAIKIPELFVGVNFWGKCSALWKNSMVKVWGPEGGIPRFYKKRILAEPLAYSSDLRFWEDFELYQRLKRTILKKEAQCKARIIHYENLTPKSIMLKYISYGRSIADFKGRFIDAPYKLVGKLTLLTLFRILKNPGNSPAIFLGCLFQAFLKALCMSLGLLLKLV
jgi:glycosyltransferase involved in cell wall biosynthesis